MGDIVEFKKPIPAIDMNQLVGKMLMLNGAMAPKFQCGGFSVNPSRMVDIVTEKTQLVPIRIALENGLLIDVSNNNIVTKGFELKNSSASKIQSEETDKKVYMGRDEFGRMFVIVPKDEEERQKYDKEFAETGKITFHPEESDGFTGFSPIIEEDIAIENNKDKEVPDA